MPVMDVWFMSQGIYKITNIKTNESYIGQSVNIEQRINQHKNELRNGNHHNSDLQKDYDSGARFTYEIIKRVANPNDLDAEERAEIARYDTYHHGYNQSPGGQYDGYGRNVGSGRLNSESNFKNKICPKCGRKILKNSSVCDCGYDFISNEVPKIHTKSRKELQKEIDAEFKKLDIKRIKSGSERRKLQKESSAKSKMSNVRKSKPRSYYRDKLQKEIDAEFKVIRSERKKSNKNLRKKYRTQSQKGNGGGFEKFNVRESNSGINQREKLQKEIDSEFEVINSKRKESDKNLRKKSYTQFQKEQTGSADLCGTKPQEKVSICPKCGKKVNSYAKLCKYCGSLLNGLTSKPPAKKGYKICPICRNYIKKWNNFCDVCGYNFKNY